MYARASTTAQDESCEQQIERAEHALRALGLLTTGARLPRYHAPAQGVYVDDGKSAWKVPMKERPAARQLLADLEHNQRPFEQPGVLWVWAPSRMLRPELGAAEAVTQIFELRKLGWAVHTYGEGSLDPCGPGGLSGTFQIALHGEKDGAHSREKAAAVRRAKDKQRATGVWLGGFAPFGYERWVVRLSPADPVTGRAGVTEWLEPLADNKRNGTRGTATLLRPSATSADWVRMIFRLAADGEDGRVVSIFEIIRRLNDRGAPPPKRARHWTTSTANTLLVNEVYTAVQRDPDGVAHPALWEPLVDRATWERVQARLAMNAAQRRGVNTDFVLSGLLFCARCGARLTGERQQRRAPLGGHRDYYRCAPSPTRDEPCPACRCRIAAERLEPAVLAAIENLAVHPAVRRAVAAERDARRAGPGRLSAERLTLDGEAADVRRQIDNLMPLLAKGGVAAERLMLRLDMLNADAARIDARRRALAGPADGDGGAKALVGRAAALAQIWEHAGPAERKAILRCFVSRIEVDAARGIVRVGVRQPSSLAA